MAPVQPSLASPGPQAKRPSTSSAASAAQASQPNPKPVAPASKAARAHHAAASRVARKLAADIAVSVARIRGLPLKRKLDVHVLGDLALRAFVVRQLEKDGGRERLRRLGRALALLDLAPPGGGLMAAYLALLGEQVAGLYDPASRTLRVMRRLVPVGVQLPNPLHLLTGSPEEQLRFVMAHEIVHALQDQRWGLAKLARDRPGETDLETALSSLFEGDATLGGLIWAMQDKQGHADLKSLLAAEAGIRWMMRSSLSLARLGLLPGGAGLARAPAFLQERLVVPYAAGLTLCMAAARRTGSYRGIDALYRAPPLSTEQVLHPEKLWGARPDPPVILRLPPLRRVLRAKGRALYADNLGELFIRRTLRGRLPEAQADRAAAGWGGDRYALYAGPKGDMLVWLTTWDTAADSSEFATAAVAWLRALQAGTASGVAVRGKDVLVWRGVPRAQVARLKARVFTGTRRRLRKRLPR